LANDEIVNGVSERGFTVVRKKMTQWSMRISAYAERLLQGLNDIDWRKVSRRVNVIGLGNQLGLWLVFQLCQQVLKAKITIVYCSKKALELRDSTVTEQKLWRSLKSKALDYKFKHQYLIGNYIVDFVCLSKNWLL
jgi:leucyl-tRNA synthetase